MRQFSVPGAAAIIALLALNPAQADSGFYLSAELGANLASGPGFAGEANDSGSICDEFINPRYATTPGCPGPHTAWKNAFDGAEGILTGVAVGYRLWDNYPDRSYGRFRLELEYSYRESNYDQTSPVHGQSGVAVDKLNNEITSATDRIGRITSHSLFGNLYFDFHNGSPLTPYLGIGAGIGLTDADYASLWVRNNDPARITTGAGLPNVEEIRRNLAGTVSNTQLQLEDTLFGFQVLAGVDYAVTDALSLGVKGRWVNYDRFRDDIVWDLVRSHPPYLRLDGSMPISGTGTLGDMDAFGISAALKYHF